MDLPGADVSTSYSRDHARVEKRIINLDTERPNVCCWDDCERLSTQLHRYRYCHHPVDRPCRVADRIALETGDPQHQWFAFCSHRHMEYFVYSGGWRATWMIESQGRAYGNLPTGSKGSRL
jgi:hypothetical protein